MQQAYQIRTAAIYKPAKPVKDAAYLAYIRRLFCVVCGATYGIEASHQGPRGLGQKSDDRSCIPLCRKHHRTANDSLHQLGPVEFAERHGIDVGAVTEKLNRFYDERLARNLKGEPE